ncbi:hypothetical protein H8Z60_28560 [Mycolicibacterium fortuitum]|nr:hypothetical protein [Mycolicibacterium fortuitum]MCA4726372.1 hypothetical protein [Mycolicibacterium fortuitum]MCA4756464.1 hypothetical protein [Mycolicibacterium fortuitum]MDG5772932.1 hypothetical protein [Mycolicibacterium fortuitum]MDG5780024.1 hypothetical protein [Mycolicibacterium fortuitum]NOQ61613.1 hypothetical protein [Mycolicibacterium fortuitum]
MRRRPREHRRLAPLPSSRRIETGPDGYDYEVRTVAASRAVKVYRCPGCDHEIRVATAHVVVLPIDVGDVDDRRHWHTACWANRANRSPTRKWS